ncbi:helix-turn-helix domain-containing protein [Shewanella sp. A25]|nr:helix-turn-helix domain-containing protein [Shewanella shenzhenensis]
MQIGTCWFNAQEQVLVDASSGSSWLLSEDEFNILTLLSKQSGKVVSRLELKQVIAPEIKPAKADERLNICIQRLRSFLGREATHLLVNVADQGFILHVIPRGQSKQELHLSKRTISTKQFLFTMAIAVSLLFWIGSRISHPTVIAPDYAKQLPMQDGTLSEIQFYTGQRKDHAMRPLVEHFLTQISSCSVFPWQSIAATISEDRRLVSLVLKNQDANGLRFETIKMMSDDFNADVIDEFWLKMVGICV